MAKDFTRKELNDITHRALELSTRAVSLLWKRVYEKLADAATTLDAFIARSSEEK